ncbi:MAG: hypothetical protein JW814_11830 [Candidatus Krumholzibacteriota bacterium]|nr:hypothetical protein [Candidatus Krumholzibacteriota bacterium]
MFCPECRSEYLDTVTTCPDCGVPLVERLEVPDENDGDISPSDSEEIEFVKILHTFSPNDILMIRSVLDAAGATYFIQGEMLNCVRHAAEPAILLVAKDQEDEVRSLLKDMDLGYFIVASLKTKKGKPEK